MIRAVRKNKAGEGRMGWRAEVLKRMLGEASLRRREGP